LGNGWTRDQGSCSVERAPGLQRIRESGRGLGPVPQYCRITAPSLAQLEPADGTRQGVSRDVGRIGRGPRRDRPRMQPSIRQRDPFDLSPAGPLQRRAIPRGVRGAIKVELPRKRPNRLRPRRMPIPQSARRRVSRSASGGTSPEDRGTVFRHVAII
jgi:hypothetical protein